MSDTERLDWILKNCALRQRVRVLHDNPEGDYWSTDMVSITATREAIDVAALSASGAA